MRKKANLGRLILPLLIAIVMVWTLFPAYWGFLASLKNKIQIFATSPLFIFDPTFENYLNLFTELHFERWILNSIIIAVTSTSITTLVSTMASYGFSSRFRFKAKEGLANFILSLYILPPIIAAVPIFILYKYLMLIDTYIGLILVYTAFNIPLAIWMMRGFFEEIPEELEDAALIDGCSRFQVFYKVVLPLIKPALVATFTICFIFAWNELLYAVFLTAGKTYTATVGMTRFVTIKRIDWGGLMAAGVTVSIPVLAIAYYTQRYLVRGLTFGAVKA